MINAERVVELERCWAEYQTIATVLGKRDNETLLDAAKRVRRRSKPRRVIFVIAAYSLTVLLVWGGAFINDLTSLRTVAYVTVFSGVITFIAALILSCWAIDEVIRDED